MGKPSAGLFDDSIRYGTSYRRVAFALVVVAGLSCVAVAGGATADSPVGVVSDDDSPIGWSAIYASEKHSGSEAIDSCTTIDEPGEYELSTDVASEGGVCVHVHSDGVVLDGNGHTISGTGNSSDGSVGLLVFNGSEDGLDRTGDALDNVTVRNLTLTEHAHGVRLGQIAGDGPTVAMENVTASDNGDGVVAYGASNSSLSGVTATGNERSGIIVGETTSLDVRDVTASSNDVDGLVFDRSVSESNVTGVTAADNGRHGLVVGMGSVDNTITNASSTNNERAGVVFADSDSTALQNATVDGNDGPGVFSDFGLRDTVENVTVTDNGIAFDSTDEQARYGVIATDFRMGSGVVGSFGTNVSSLGDGANVPELPENASEAGPAVNLTLDREDGAAQTSLTFPYDADTVGENGTLTAWRYADGAWEEVTDVRIDEDAETVTATVERGGVVVPVVRGVT